MFYIIYKITNKVNGKIYIGKHQTEDLNDGYMGSGKLILAAIEKYGIENFEKETLFQFDNEEDMNNKEKELVNEEFCLREDTYNLCVGGQGGWSYVNSNELQTEYQKKKASEWTLSNQQKIQKKTEKRTKHILKLNKLRTGSKHNDQTKKIMSEKAKERTGPKNSQYGTMWISNGVQNKKIKKDDVIPEGWFKGRILNLKS